MTVNLSYIVKKKNITDCYTSSLEGFYNKDVEYKNIQKLMLNSKIQYSNLLWNYGRKISKQLNMDKVDCIILDIDDGVSINEFQKQYKKYTYYLATTKSHQKEKKGEVCDRYRVLFPAINISKDYEVFARSISIFFPMVDVQTLTKTGAYLGNSDGIYIENTGKMLDMHNANILAEQYLTEEEQERLEAINVPKELRTVQYGSIDIDDLKNNLTRDIVREILTDIGIQFEGYKCSLRDERTKSVKIYGYYLKDYGDDEESGDIFQVLMDRENMSFRDAIKYVSQYV